MASPSPSPSPVSPEPHKPHKPHKPHELHIRMGYSGSESSLGVVQNRQVTCLHPSSSPDGDCVISAAPRLKEGCRGVLTAWQWWRQHPSFALANKPLVDTMMIKHHVVEPLQVVALVSG